MSATAAARNPQPPARSDRLRFKRPESVSDFCALPHRGVDFEGTVTQTDQAIYFYIKNDPGTRETKEGHRLDNAPGYSEIARAVRVSRRTVARRIRTMIDKGYMRALVRIERGRRVGTTYVLPYWSTLREQWKRDPNIATMPNGDPIVQGRGKRFMTREQAREWKIAGAMNAAEPETAKAEPLEMPAPAATGDKAPEEIRPPPDVPDLSPLIQTLATYCDSFDQSDLELIWREANTAYEGEPRPTIEDVAAVANKTARRLKFDLKLPFITPKRLADATRRSMNAWRVKAAEQRKAAAKQAQSAHDKAVNELITYLMDLDNPDLTPEGRALASDKVGGAPPEIAAAAYRGYNAQKARKTGAAGA